MKAIIFLFDDFDLIDAFGPAGILGKIPEHFSVNYVSVKGGFISSAQGLKVWTDPLEPEKACHVMVIPGGKGARKVLGQSDEETVMVKKAVEHADNCLMIDAGSGIIAQTGLLFHRNIVDCQQHKSWNQMFTAGMTRITDIDWVEDGKFYSARSAKSGIDMTLSFVGDLIDINVADQIADSLGYPWNYYAEENHVI